MGLQQIYIKNMVCPRCIEAVTEILEAQELDPQDVQLGQACIGRSINREQLNSALKARGFELVMNRNEQMVAEIKSFVIGVLLDKETMDSAQSRFPKYKNSDYISKHLGKPYTQLSKAFSATEGITIEKYIILQKIERVKELLSYKEMTLSEIAYELDYSSVQHLSTQFKSVTGYSVTQYKQLKDNNRKGLDSI